MSLIKKLMFSLVLLSSTATIANGESNLSLPDVTAENQENYRTEDQVINDLEIMSQTDLFIDRGYQRLEFISHGKLVDQVLKELVDPDYEQRTGRKNPNDYGIDIAQAYITKRGFYDIVVLSRLPGDCGTKGCLFQVYSLIGNEWYKQLEFQAMDFVYKDGKVDGTTLVASVAEEDGVSKIFYWDEEKFVDY